MMMYEKFSSIFKSKTICKGLFSCETYLFVAFIDTDKRYEADDYMFYFFSKWWVENLELFIKSKWWEYKAQPMTQENRKHNHEQEDITHPRIYISRGIKVGYDYAAARHGGAYRATSLKGPGVRRLACRQQCA